MSGTTQVLVAEGDEGIRDLVAFTCAHAGYLVRAVPDGATTLAAVQQDRPRSGDPGCDDAGPFGFDVLWAARQETATAAVAVILLPAKSRAAEIDTGFATGAQDYVVKPFSGVLHRVQGVLARVPG